MNPLKSKDNSFHRSTMAQAFLNAGVVSDTPLIRSPKATVTDRKSGKVRSLSVPTPGAFGKRQETVS